MTNMFMSPLSRVRSAGERKCWMGRLLMIKSSSVEVTLLWNTSIFMFLPIHWCLSIYLFTKISLSPISQSCSMMYYLSPIYIIHWGKGSSQTSWGLLDKSSKLTLIPGDPNVSVAMQRHGHIGRVRAYRWGSWIPSVVISPVLEHIIIIDLFSSWQNPSDVSLTNVAWDLLSSDSLNKSH